MKDNGSQELLRNNIKSIDNYYKKHPEENILDKSIKAKTLKKKLEKTLQKPSIELIEKLDYTINEELNVLSSMPSVYTIILKTNEILTKFNNLLEEFNLHLKHHENDID
ncbi:MAG: hypothetical protein PHF05_06405 [Candidatus Izemoplasmatales bacterium]|nr:hypothetical protein [Candidatus Izemoplasmatales bacterium]